MAAVDIGAATPEPAAGVGEAVVKNPILPGADPHALVAGGTFWVYPTFGRRGGEEFHAFSSTNLISWERHGPVLSLRDVPWIKDDGQPRHGAWAPCIEPRGGRFYFYYSVGPQDVTPSRIGVAVGDNPAGPFKDSGKPLLVGGPGFEAIDPMVFTDPKSGRAYFYAGGSAGSKLRVFELNEDRVSFGREVPVATPPNFTEGVFLHWRDGRYYLSYSHGGWQNSSYSVHYATAESPTGPWHYQGAILTSDARHKGPGHHSVVRDPATGRWLIFYHRWNNQSGDGPYRGSRQVCVDRLEYDADGLLKPVAMTDAWPAPREQASQVPGVVIDHSPASAGLYIGSPSLAVLTNGDYLASHDFFGPKGEEFGRPTSAVFRSADRGRTWQKIARIDGAFWSSLFVHEGAAYLLGTDRHHGNAVIRRSTDGGVTWTAPTNAACGLLRDNGEYHCAPVPVIAHAGRLWRAMERRDPPVGWGINYRAGMMSAPVAADLLQATNWTFADFLPSDRAWNGGDMGAWLEGNAVVAPEGGVVNLLRVETLSADEKAALVRVSADGRTLAFDPATGLVNFPGGAKKFTGRFDPQSRLYWSLASVVPEAQRAERPGRLRNTLALIASPDLRAWTERCLLLRHPDRARHGFQYVDWLFDGEDIIAACRTAYDDDQGGAHTYHDANYLTFHRWRNFRRLTLADSVPLPGSITPTANRGR
jgi:hypothetical protein